MHLNSVNNIKENQGNLFAKIFQKWCGSFEGVDLRKFERMVDTCDTSST